MVCPKCGPVAAVMTERCTDVDFYGDEDVAVTYKGTCLWCKRRYQWTEIYQYNHTENIIDIGMGPQEEEED